MILTAGSRWINIRKLWIITFKTGWNLFHCTKCLCRRFWNTHYLRVTIMPFFSLQRERMKLLEIHPGLTSKHIMRIAVRWTFDLRRRIFCGWRQRCRFPTHCTQANVGNFQALKVNINHRTKFLIIPCIKVFIVILYISIRTLFTAEAAGVS